MSNSVINLPSQTSSHGFEKKNTKLLLVIFMDVKSKEIVPLIWVFLKSYKDTRKMNEKAIKTPNVFCATAWNLKMAECKCLIIL